MAFIEPMHRNKPNITYLLQRYLALRIIATKDTDKVRCYSQISYIYDNYSTVNMQ